MVAASRALASATARMGRGPATQARWRPPGRLYAASSQLDDKIPAYRIVRLDNAKGRDR